MTEPEVPPEIGAFLASLSEQTPSNDVSEVVRAAPAARDAAPLQQPPRGDEVAAFGRGVDDVRRTLASLSAAHWSRPAVNGLTVGELVGHLTGTQIDLAAELGLEPRASGSSDHIENTRASIDAAVRLTPNEAADEFARTSRIVTNHLATLDAAGLAAPAHFGPIVADVRFLLVGRVFELWTHDNDLRTAVGLPRVDPDRERLWMMTRTVMPLVRAVGSPAIRIVLTGPGGGVWPAEGAEIAEIAVDSAAFCRRIANRATVDELHADIDGDRQAAHDTLTALAALALD